MDYQSYAEYSISNSTWLDSFPSAWDTRKLKFAVTLINEKIEAKGSELEYMGLEHIGSWTGKKLLGGQTESDGVGSVFEKGDVLFGKLRPYLAKVYKAEGSGLATSEALVLRPEEIISPNFLKYYLLTPSFIDVVNGSTYGAKMPRASWDFIGELPILLPDIKEQQKIAAFLDYKTQKIDQLIEKKKALIEKLEEKRIAVITQVVTKGLDKNTKLKPSGVDWLGDVPEHWDVLAIKRNTPVSRGASPRPIEDPKYFDDDGEYAWVRIADVSSNYHYLENTTQRLSELGKSLSVPLEPGTLFLSIAGTVGKPMITNIKCCIHDGFVYFPYLTINPEFLYYIFLSGKPYLGLGKMGTQLNLNTDTVGGIKIAMPSDSEQAEIVSYLEGEMLKLDKMVEKVTSAKEKLEEYRAAIITSAVTGRIDVRKVEIPGGVA